MASTSRRQTAVKPDEGMEVCEVVPDPLEMLARPSHRAIEVREVQRRRAGDGVPVLPNLGRPITARIEEPMQHRHEHRPLDGELELPVLEQVRKNLRESQLTPDPLEHQRRPDPDRRGFMRLALLMRLEHRRLFGEAGAGGDQGIDLAGGL